MELFHPSWAGPRIQKHSVERCAVLGDIHGRADLLLPLLAHLGDRPVFVAGDLCDRGSDTRTCIEALVEVGARGVLGNHDLWFARWASGEGFDSHALGQNMGGIPTLHSYGAGPPDWEKVPRDHADFLNHLALVVDLDVDGDPFWIMHAGVSMDRPLPSGSTIDDVVPFLAEHHPADLLWRKNQPEDIVPVDRPIIMGHTPRPQPVVTEAVYAIDTGAGAGYHRLTALLLPERVFVSSP